MNCSSDYITVKTFNGDDVMSKTYNSSTKNVCGGQKNNTSDGCFLNDNKCGDCYCHMHKQQDDDNEILVVEKCECNKPILKEGNCSCGDVKVAPWGSMLPVYSRTTETLYKNPVCAACHGVVDGIVWIPVIQCIINSLRSIDFELEDYETCYVNFVEPESIERFLLPRCHLKHSTCFKHFQIPSSLNMTTRQIIDACDSDFFSIYNNREKNAFCAVCRGTYHEENKCYFDSYVKAAFDKVTFLMTLDYLIEKTALSENPKPRKIPLACSSSVSIFFFFYKISCFCKTVLYFKNFLDFVLFQILNYNHCFSYG